MTTALTLVCPETPSIQDGDLLFRCSRCLRVSGAIPECDDNCEISDQRCSGCGAMVYKARGVWRSLSAARREQLAPFLAKYEEIREWEGRGSAHPAFYLALPFADLTGRFSGQWKIRARSFRYLESKILPRLEREYGSRFRVLDIGAGNGWLSYRLALLGYRPVAVDLCCNAWDGLEAAEHYASVLPEFFPRVEAEMDALPFSEAQFDVAIFNASFHYSTNYERTLSEVLRCLRPGGTILILDSPTYRLTEHGEKMREERKIQLRMPCGPAGQGVPTGDFLTPRTLERLSDLGVRWTPHLAWYGLQWFLRPWVARMKGRRAPSQFFIYEGQTETA